MVRSLLAAFTLVYALMFAALVGSLDSLPSAIRIAASPAAALLVLWPGLRMAFRSCAVFPDYLEVRGTWRSYRVDFDSLHSITATPFQPVGRLLAWGWVLVAFGDDRGRGRLVVTAATSKGNQTKLSGPSLDKAVELWTALPDGVRLRVAPPSFVPISPWQLVVYRHGWPHRGGSFEL